MEREPKNERARRQLQVQLQRIMTYVETMKGETVRHSNPWTYRKKLSCLSSQLKEGNINTLCCSWGLYGNCECSMKVNNIWEQTYFPLNSFKIVIIIYFFCLEIIIFNWVFIWTHKENKNLTMITISLHALYKPWNWSFFRCCCSAENEKDNV